MNAGVRRWRVAVGLVLAAAVAAGFALVGRDPTSNDLPPAPSAVVAIEETPGGPTRMTKEPGGCAVVFDTNDAHVSDEAIRLAVLDDATTDCRGRRIRVVERKPVATVSATLARGDEAIVDDAGLGASVVARVAVGTATSPCAGDVGVLAIVTLRGRRLVVDALAPWQAPCSDGAGEPISVVDVGREHALLEEDGESTENGSIRFERVWLRRGAALIHAGDVLTELTEDHRTMSAELRSRRDALVATETWGLGDGGHVVRDRTYTVGGNTLLRAPDADP